MQKALEQIQELQRKMGYQGYIDKHMDNRMDYARDTALAILIELVEVLQVSPWKPWRELHEQVYDPPKIAQELCDVLVFLLNLYNTLCPRESLEEAWARTLEKIEKRIENENYGKKE